MSESTHSDVVIIGAGPAGLAAALYTGRAMLDTVVLERGIPGGELLNTEFLDDVPGFSRVLGHDLAVKLFEHAESFGARFVLGVSVTSVKKRIGDGLLVTLTEGGDEYLSPAVIVAAGGTPAKLGVPGELEYAGRGVSYCAVCDGAFFREQHVIVVGGGDAACEEAEYLTRFASRVTLIHRRKELRAAPLIQRRVTAHPKIDLMLETTVEEVLGAATGMTGVLVKSVATGVTRVIAAAGLFVFIGFRPNTSLLPDDCARDGAGYVITDLAMHTSIPGLFCAGDMRAQLARQVTTAQGDATTAAIAVYRYLAALRSGAPDPAAAIVGEIGMPIGASRAQPVEDADAVVFASAR